MPDRITVSRPGTLREAAQLCSLRGAFSASFIFPGMLFDDCIEEGKSIADGEARYLGAVAESFGTANADDSLAAIKELVCDRRKKGEPPASGNTSTAGREINGVSAFLNSICKPDPPVHAGYVRNMKFSKQMSGGGLVKLKALSVPVPYGQGQGR